jgi:signal transduction histidine kinase
LADIIAALQRRPKSLILAFTASVLVAVAALQAADLWWRRDQTLETAEARARNLAFVLSEHIRGTFADVDTTLRQLAIHARRVGGPDAPAEAWDPILNAARAALPGSGSLTVTDANGTIRRSTQAAIVGHSRRDNYIFKQLASIGRDDLVIDRPFLTPIPPKRYVIPVGRRLSTDEGQFDGTVVSSVMPEAYREFFHTVDVGAHGIVTVFHPDGVVLFREPSDTDPIGETATGSAVLAAALRARSGVLSGPLEPGGPEFLSGFHTVGTPPLIVAVSLNTKEVLADWRQQRRTTVLAFAALTLTLAGMLSVLFRQMTARANVEHELGHVQRLEAARLLEANERLEQALEREQNARQETEAASYLKDEFLMTVSHELRTPLTAIYGWVRMLANDSMRADERRRALAALERSARAQAKLIDDLLDMSRSISGKLRIDARAVNVSDVVRAAIDTVRPALDAKAIKFQSTVDPAMAPIVADPDRVQQMVWNLLSNAIKFTPDGGTVTLHVRRADSHVEIAVTDTGIGIAPDFLPYVFDRFRQGDAGTQRRYGGLGLGLAIVRHLVELHGGTVSAESAGENQGSTFRVVLPARAIRAEAQAEQTVERIEPT